MVTIAEQIWLDQDISKLAVFFFEHPIGEFTLEQICEYLKKEYKDTKDTLEYILYIFQNVLLIQIVCYYPKPNKYRLSDEGKKLLTKKNIIVEKDNIIHNVIVGC